MTGKECFFLYVRTYLDFYKGSQWGDGINLRYFCLTHDFPGMKLMRSTRDECITCLSRLKTAVKKHLTTQERNGELNEFVYY